MNEHPTWTPKPGYGLLMRTCGPHGESQHPEAKGFVWPLSPGSVVVAPDWSPEPKCGGGLHGLLWGCGDSSVLSWQDDAVWIAAEVELASVVEIEEAGPKKVKVPRAVVVAAGARHVVASLVARHAPNGSAVHGGTSTSGEGGTSTSGHDGTSTSGDYGTSTSGDYGTSTSGYGGTSTSGDYGTSTSGYGGTSTSGHGGTSTSGEGGIIQIRRWDGSRYRVVTGYIGEDGLEPGVPYRLDKEGKLVRAEKGAEP